MKKTFFAIAVILASTGLKAQTNQPNVSPPPIQQDYVFISVTHFFESTYLLSYERFNENLDRSTHISAGLIARGGNDRTKFGGMVSLQKRFYFIDPAIHKESLEEGRFNHGIYFAPYATYKYINAKNITYAVNPTTGELEPVTYIIESNSIQGGILVGLQFSLAKVVYVDTYLGGGIHYPGPVEGHIYDFGVYPLTYSGVMVKAGASVGIKF